MHRCRYKQEPVCWHRLITIRVSYHNIQWICNLNHTTLDKWLLIQLDDIIHFFVLCPETYRFWLSSSHWWNTNTSTGNPLYLIILPEGKQIIFGITSHKIDPYVVLNYCIMHAKYHIYRQKLYSGNNLVFTAFLMKLKYKLNIKKYICEWKETENKFW